MKGEFSTLRTELCKLLVGPSLAPHPVQTNASPSATLSPVSSSDQYRERLADREASVAAYEKIHIHLGNIRLALAFVAILLALGLSAPESFCS
jgi:hypothetical protein